MKNRICLLVVGAAIIISCNKDDIVPGSAERGTIIGNPVLSGTYSKTWIASALSAIAGDYAENINCSFDVELYKINYNTIDPEGNPTLASGLIAVPIDSATIFPLLSWQHGTASNKMEVPSNYLIDQSDLAVALLFAAAGFVVSCPDYLGMGSGTKLNPYLHAQSEATAVIDMVRATRLLCRDKGFLLNEQLFLAGYSQGGHSTMAALKMIEEQYSDEFSVTACSPMAGPYDLAETTFKFVMRDTAYPVPGFLPYILFAYNSVYGMYPDLSTVFVSPYYDEFRRYLNDTVFDLRAVNNLWPASNIPSVVLKSEVIGSLKQDPDNPILLALKDNDLYDWAPQSPIHLCHCDSDDIVPYQNSVVAYNSFVNHNATQVTLVMPLQGGNHSTCAIPSVMDAYIWFGSLRQ